MTVALSLETARQNVATQSATSPVGSGLVAERQGSYRSESVKPTTDNSVLTKAAAEGAGVTTTSRNLRDLAQRVQKDPAVTTAALYDSLAEMPGLEGTPLPEMFEFIDGLAELVGDEAAAEVGQEAGQEKVAEEREGHEVGREESSEREAPADLTEFNALRGREGHGGDSSQSDGEERGRDRLEDGINHALGKLDGNADKAAAIALARGYFEAKGANLNFLNVLGRFAAEFQDVVEQSTLAQLAAAEEAMLAAATLETSPATVRRRYRKLLREKRSLGELFEELARIGSEESFWTLLSEIGSDLAGINGRSDRDYLRSLTSELKKLWQLKSAHDETKELCRITEPHLSKSGCKAEPQQLTASFLYYCGKSTVGPGDAQSLLGIIKGASLGSQVVFANALRELHGRMPDGIWLASRDRLLQYTALGALCHRLTEAEERFHEESGAS
jgi:hypothetical protein